MKATEYMISVNREYSEMKKKLANFFLEQGIPLQHNSHSLSVHTVKSPKSTSFAQKTALKQQFSNILVWDPPLCS